MSHRAHAQARAPRSHRLGGLLSTIVVCVAVVGFLLRPSLLPLFYEPEAGDLIFQSLPRGLLVDTIEGVSESRWSHCGIVLQEDGEWFVLEAIGPVRKTPLGTWMEQGRGYRFAAYRLRPEHRAAIPAMLATAETQLGKPYDVHYEFDDSKIYCSELIHMAYRAATGHSLGQVQKLGELNWRPHEQNICELSQRAEPPLERLLITPVAITRAPELELVHEGGW